MYVLYPLKAITGKILHAPQLIKANACTFVANAIHLLSQIAETR